MAKAKKTEVKNKQAVTGKKTGKGQKSLAPKTKQKAASGKESRKDKAEKNEALQEKRKTASKKISVRSEIDRLEKNNSSKDLKKTKDKSLTSIRKGAPKSHKPEAKSISAKTETVNKSDKTKKKTKTADPGYVRKQSNITTPGSKSSAMKSSSSRGIKQGKDTKTAKKNESKGKTKSQTPVKKTGNKKKAEIILKEKKAVNTHTVKEKKKSNINALSQNRKTKNAQGKSSGKTNRTDSAGTNLSTLSDSVHVKRTERTAPKKHAPVLLKNKNYKTEAKSFQDIRKHAAVIPQDIDPQIKKERKIKLGETKDLWEFYSDQDGDFLAKLYTEDKSVYTELLKIKEIKRSAKYFRNGSFIGADFIIPYDRLIQVCGIAGLKAPKI